MIKETLFYNYIFAKKMDYEDFYSKQSDFPVYRGIRHQRGYGLGGVFRKLFRFIIPLMKEHAMPILKSVGESAIKGAANFAQDTIAGKNVKESVSKRLSETVDDLKRKASMNGSGINKRKNYSEIDFFENKIKKKKLNNKKRKKKSEKRKSDIFD